MTAREVKVMAIPRTSRCACRSIGKTAVMVATGQQNGPMAELVSEGGATRETRSNVPAVLATPRLCYVLRSNSIDSNCCMMAPSFLSASLPLDVDVTEERQIPVGEGFGKPMAQGSGLRAQGHCCEQSAFDGSWILLLC